MKRLFFGLAAVILMTAALGCEPDAAGESAPAEGETEAGDRRAAQEKAVDLTIVFSRTDRPMLEDFDTNQDSCAEYVESRTGIGLRLTALNPADDQELLHAMMNAADGPDAISTNDPAWISKTVDLDLLTPLDELLRTSAQTLKALYPEDAWKAVTFKGRIYAVPNLAEVPGDEVMYVRKDWLDALGLKPPETLDEYYEVMYAFTYKDPDRNGRNDTIGFTMLPDGFSRAAPFFGAFGIPRGEQPMMQWKEQEGSLVYAGMLPEMKEALAFLSKLYGDGLLDRQFILNKQESFEANIVNGRVGLFAASWQDTEGPMQENQKRDPKAEWIRLPYPKGPGGQSGTAGLAAVQSYTVIPKHSEHADEVLRVLTWIAGEGQRMLKLGCGDGGQIEAGGSLLADLADPNDPQVRKEWLDALGQGQRWSEDAEYVLEHVLSSDYLGPLTPSMARYGASLNELENVTFLRMVMGLEPLEEFDRFVNRWMAEGGWEMTHEVNQWLRESLKEEH